MRPDELTRILDAIDAANADDPYTITVGGVERPKELAHAQMMTAWVERLDPEAGPAQLIAARAHHLRRWTVPRSSAPTGRKGYLRWRAARQRQHAEDVAEILEAHGAEAELVEDVQCIVRKEGLGRDGRVQTHEDALCLVFLETQFDGLIADQGEDKTVGIVVKSLAKMSPSGREAAATLRFGARERAVLERALAAREDAG